mgnify:CR=1 FL=1
MNPFVEAEFYVQGVMSMIGTERYCNKCGHRCHCYQPDCDECVNDVCTNCQCKNEKDIPSSFTKENV